MANLRNMKFCDNLAECLMDRIKIKSNKHGFSNQVENYASEMGPENEGEMLEGDKIRQ